MRDRAILLFEALKIGIVVNIGDQKYKLREDGQLLFEGTRYSNEQVDKIWLGYPSEICSLIGLAKELTDVEAYIISVNISLINQSKKRNRK